MHEYGAALERAFDAILTIDRRDPMPTADLVALWLDVDVLSRELARVLHILHDDASDRVFTDIPDVTFTYTSSAGEPVHLAPGYAAERWRGHDVVAELADDYVDPTSGELVQAIPVAVLVDVLPGCGQPDQTSSRWRTTGLGRYLPDWRRYRSKDKAPLVLRRGERP